MTAQAWSLTDLENKMLFQMVLSHREGMKALRRVGLHIR